MGGRRPPFPDQPKCDSTPAMVAVISVAMVPPSTARRPKRARSERRSGASPPMPPPAMRILSGTTDDLVVMQPGDLVPGQAKDTGKDLVRMLAQDGCRLRRLADTVD